MTDRLTIADDLRWIAHRIETTTDGVWLQHCADLLADVVCTIENELKPGGSLTRKGDGLDAPQSAVSRPAAAS